MAGFLLMIGAVLLVFGVIGTLDCLLFERPKAKARRRWVHTRWYNRR